MRRKLLIAFLTVLFIGVSITGFFSMNLSRDFYVKSLEDRLTSNATLISKVFTESYEPDRKNYDSLVRDMAVKTKSRITIVADDGVVLGESNKESSQMENHSEREEIKKAMSGQTGKSFRYSTTEKIDMMYIAVPADMPDGRKAVIRLAVPLTEIENIERYFLRYIIFAVTAGLLGSSIIAYIFTRRITRPIKEMTIISSEIAKGRYDKRITIQSRDEIALLAQTLNSMADRLQTTIIELSDKKNKLEAILKSMQSGVIAVDNIGRIILVNPAAVNIFGFSGNIVGRHILEAIRNVELEDIIYKHQETNREISLNYPEKRVLRVKAAPIKDVNGSDRNLGVVVVMQDITELKRLEKVRSDFVANVSHELKTPLTSIKGFTETLKEGAAEDPAIRDKFLDIINIEADRLTRLINDILTISELENKRYNIPFEKISVNKALEEIEDMMHGVAKLKNISLGIDKGENLHPVMGNLDKVKQLLINLIDNAIKYTHEGGSVKVRTYSRDSWVFIEVADTGIGISKEHLSRLFERFYRVDKGRSRAMGGTGLGLAIVKHIIAAMNGDIEVKSEPGKGTVFTVIIPKA